MTSEIADYPTPDELVAAHRTLSRLGRAIYADLTWEGDRMQAWEAVIEAKLRLAQVTDALGDEYAAVWNTMAGQDE